MPSVRFRGL